MNIKQKVTIFILAISSTLMMAVTPLTASAINNCGVETSIISCPTKVDNKSGDVQKNGIWALLLLVINILSAGVGIVAVGGIVYGSIMFASAGDSSERVKKATGIITNVVIGVIAYVAMFAFLQYLIPGGIFA